MGDRGAMEAVVKKGSECSGAGAGMMGRSSSERPLDISYRGIDSALMEAYGFAGLARDAPLVQQSFRHIGA